MAILQTTEKIKGFFFTVKSSELKETQEMTRLSGLFHANHLPKMKVI